MSATVAARSLCKRKRQHVGQLVKTDKIRKLEIVIESINKINSNYFLVFTQSV